MRDEIVAKLYTAYGVTPARLLPMQKGYRNESHPAELADGSHLNLIIYKTEPGIVARIKNSNYVGDFLHSHGLPARSTADPRILRVTLTKYAALYHYLPGDTIPWDGYTQKHLKALGQAMSDMHAVLQQLADGRQPPDGQELRRGSGSPQSSSMRRGRSRGYRRKTSSIHPRKRVMRRVRRAGSSRSTD